MFAIWDYVWGVFGLTRTAAQTAAALVTAATSLTVILAVISKILPRLFSPAIWVPAVTGIAAVAWSFLYGLLPSGAQTAISGGATFVTTNPIFVGAFNVVYWVSDQFVAMPVILALVAMYVQIVLICCVIKGVVAVYNLIPGRSGGG